MKDTGFPVVFPKQRVILALFMNLFVLGLVGLFINQKLTEHERQATIIAQNLSQVLDKYIKVLSVLAGTFFM